MRASALNSSSTFLVFCVQLLESLNCFYTGELECRFKTFHSFDWHHFIRRFASTAWTQLLDFHSSNHSLLISDSSHVLRGRFYSHLYAQAFILFITVTTLSRTGVSDCFLRLSSQSHDSQRCYHSRDYSLSIY